MNIAQRILRRFGVDTHGTLSVEFALGAPILALMICGAIEFGSIMFASTLMEGALREASRYGVTGQEPDEAARLTKIMQIINQHTIGLVDMSEATVQILVYPSFGDIGNAEEFVDGNGNGTYDAGETFTDTNGNGAWDADIGVAGPGGSGDIVVYRMTYDWHLLTPFFSYVVGGPTVPLSASIAVRNEPWDTGSPS
jgi:Flp pilus assembly protein TadG